MRIGLMVEGQHGLTWEKWIHILKTAERLNFPSLFRSDHYYIFRRQQESLDAFLSFAIAARETESIRFGPLVSPVTFRSPADIGRMSAQIDLLSHGRFVLGLGAGWYKAEHDSYGIPFPPVRERFDRLDEAIEVIKTLWGQGPASYEGQYYSLKEADCLPKPSNGTETPLLIGGTGEKRSIPMAAKYADEWNCVNLPLKVFAKKSKVLDKACEVIGRDPETISRSMMSMGLVASNLRSLDRLTKFQMGLNGLTGDPVAYRNEMSEKHGFMVGLTTEIADKLGEFSDLGLDEIQFQWFNYASDEVPEYLASDLRPLVT